jgi:hypothetical protein
MVEMPPIPRLELYELPNGSTIVVPVPDGGLTLYRLLEHETPSERDFEPNLSRNQAKIRGVPELFRGSISHWLEHGQAVRASERSTCFVSRLELSSGGLLRVALTEDLGRGHVDVWAHPQELLRAVVEVVRERKRA